MAVAVGVLSDTRRRTLEAVCDTFAPSIDVRRRGPGRCEPSSRAPRRTSASRRRSRACSRRSMLPEEIEALGQLLDAFAEHDFAASRSTRARRSAARDRRLEPRGEARRAPAARADVPVLLRAARRAGPQPELGGDRLSRARSRAPPSPEQAPKTIAVEQVAATDGDARGRRLRRRLRRRRRRDRGGAAAGRPSVVVLEMGHYRNESDFKQLELPGMLELYLGGGLAASEDGSIAILAGSTLGGGTVVNYMNCIRTPEHIRREWAQMGVEGIDEPELRASTSTRSGSGSAVNDDGDVAEPHAQEADRGVRAARLPAPRRSRATPTARARTRSVCGYCFAGCQKGCKQSTMKTFLQDAADAGARFVVGAPRRADPRARRPRGRRAGDRHARGRLDHRADGRRADRRRRVRRDRVAGAAAALGHRRSGRRQAPAPAPGVARRRASTSSRSRAGSARSSRRCRTSSPSCEGDHGFLIEAIDRRARLILAMSLPWVDGAEHKELTRAALSACRAVHLRRPRPRRGRGRDRRRTAARSRAGRSTTSVDARMFRRAMVELAQAAPRRRREGDRHASTSSRVTWREGEDFDAFLARDRARLARGQRRRRVHRPPDGLVPDGLRPAPSRSPTDAASCTTRKGVWIGDALRVPDRARRQPDDLDHVARAPHGGEHRGGVLSGGPSVPGGADRREVAGGAGAGRAAA